MVFLYKIYSLIFYDQIVKRKILRNDELASPVIKYIVVREEKTLKERWADHAWHIFVEQN